ncbi:MAG: dephospho-CoA kinase [Muribaculaceae bacterium]|nr:dephospho-CoA kinase [Muribaculaceae bacterium]
MTPITIAITGGIGSGKSVVSKILRCLGFQVFDCDSEAKVLMDGDENIKKEIASTIDSQSIYLNGAINRKRLAEVVFNSPAKLEILNKIVHGAVRDRIEQWRRSIDAPVAFVETAILYQSGLNRSVDAEWRIVAPEELRILRVMRRNNANREEVKQRIESQQFDPSATDVQPPLTEIVNDDATPLLPQILEKIYDKSR